MNSKEKEKQRKRKEKRAKMVWYGRGISILTAKKLR